MVPQPVWISEAWLWESPRFDSGDKVHYFHTEVLDGIMDEWIEACPFGKVGDRLWVRETWAGELNDVVYRADCSVNYKPADSDKKGFDWHPSIHMPRWASRIMLEIVEVWIERIQEIDNHDCWEILGMLSMEEWPAKYWKGFELGQHEIKEVFAEHWNSIYAKPKPKRSNGRIIHYISYPRDDDSRDPRKAIGDKIHLCFSNPWGWRIKFRRV